MPDFIVSTTARLSESVGHAGERLGKGREEGPHLGAVNGAHPARRYAERGCHHTRFAVKYGKAPAGASERTTGTVEEGVVEVYRVLVPQRQKSIGRPNDPFEGIVGPGLVAADIDGCNQTPLQE